MEFLEQVQDDEGTGGTFLNTVCESFAMSMPRVQALQMLVSSQPSEVSSDLGDLFKLDSTFLGIRFGGWITGLHLKENNLFLLKTGGEAQFESTTKRCPVKLWPAGAWWCAA